MTPAKRDELIASAEAFMKRYEDAFVHGTRDDLQEMVQKPVIFITEKDIHVRERYPFDPVKLRAATAYHHTKSKTTFIHIESTRAHAIVDGTRHRADGSVIETIQSVYILQDRGDGWKVAAFSGIRIPVEPE